MQVTTATKIPESALELENQANTAQQAANELAQQADEKAQEHADVVTELADTLTAQQQETQQQEDNTDEKTAGEVVGNITTTAVDAIADAGKAVADTAKKAVKAVTSYSQRLTVRKDARVIGKHAGKDICLQAKYKACADPYDACVKVL